MTSTPWHLVICDAVRIWGGAERFVVDAAMGLSNERWRVTVLAYPGSPLEREARRRGLRVHTARTRANGAPWTVFPLVGWMGRNKVDCLLSVYDKDLRTAAWAARLSGRNIAVVHSRECDTPIKNRPWIRFFHTRVADRIIVNSAATRETTLRSAPWLDPDRVHVVAKGIDISAFDPMPREAGEAAVLGFAGQLVGRKRVNMLIDAMAEIAPTHHLRIAGEGPCRPELEARVRELDLAGRVSFDGFVTDLGAWLSKIDILVLPSLVEGWGYVLAEAAAAGRAIVAFDASSVGEVVDTHSGAVLLAPGASLAQALHELVAEGPRGWTDRGSRLRAHANASLGVDKMISNLENELLVALRRRGRLR